MAIYTDKFLFLHVPKTGGIWVKQVLTHIGINYQELGHQHEHYPSLSKHKPPEFFQDRYVFTFVRHPITWYQSRWAFRMKMGWQAQHPLDWNCASNDFNTFVQRTLSFCPAGWCTWLYNSYINHYRPDGRCLVDFIGRTENLTDDLISVLNHVGHDFDESQVRQYSETNTSSLDGRRPKDIAKYSPDLYKRIINTESIVINRFYYDYEINPKDHCSS